MESFIGRSFDVITLKEQRKRKIVFAMSAVVIILISSILIYLAYHWYINRQYTSYKVLESVSVKDGNSMKYVSYKDGIIRYGRDGASAVDSKGNTLWNGSYDMVNPKISVCNSSVVVADIGGKSVYVSRNNETGIDFTVDYPIVQASVSDNGVVAILWEEESSNTIGIYNPYDKSRKLLAEIPTNVEDGYPVSIAISPDGSSVAASYLCVTTGAVQSRVAFYNFSNIGKNYNYLVGAHNYNKTIISEIRFMDNSNIVLFGEKGFYIWNNIKQPKSICDREFNEEITGAFSDENKIGIITKKSDNSGRMLMFDSTGKETLNIKTDNDFAQIHTSSDEIILSSANKCDIFRTNGVHKFQCKLKDRISYIFPSKKKNRYFIIQNSKIKIIKLK